MSQPPNRKRDFHSVTLRFAPGYQMAAIVAVLAIVGYLIHNTVINLPIAVLPPVLVFLSEAPVSVSSSI
jgi:hypothetical protein